MDLSSGARGGAVSGVIERVCWVSRIAQPTKSYTKFKVDEVSQVQVECQVGSGPHGGDLTGNFLGEYPARC